MNLAEDKCNDTYGRIRMYQALLLKQPEGIRIPGERTVYRVMEEIGLSHRPKRRPNGITKADREARKSDDLLKRDFTSEEPLKKCITDITGLKAKDGKLCVSAIFDCFDAAVPGLAMDTNMKAALCRQTPGNAVRSYPALREAVVHAWTKAAREGRLNAGSGSHTPETAMNLAKEPALLRRQVREQENNFSSKFHFLYEIFKNILYATDRIK